VSKPAQDMMPRLTSMLEQIYFVWLLLTLILGRHEDLESKILSQHQTSHGLICSLHRLYLGGLRTKYLVDNVVC
jgi:hypothetical protein